MDKQEITVEELKNYCYRNPIPQETCKLIDEMVMKVMQETKKKEK